MRPSHGFPKQKLFILLTVAAGACTNQIGPSHETGAAGSASPSGAGGSGSPTGAGGKPVNTTGVAGGAVNPTGIGGAVGTADACPSTAVAATPLRRLTKFEYANTVKNLLNVDTAPVSDLPADEVTDGFNNNAGILTVSSLHAEKYVLVSEALAKAAVANLGTLTGNCSTTTTAAETSCATAFAKSFGRRAFRRPTTADDEAMLMAAFSAGRDGGTFSEGIEVMIRAALQSSHFLYRLELTTPTATQAMVPLSQFEMATRLSYLLWAAGPDDALLDSAGRGELGTKAAVEAKARAMLADSKARVGVTDFYNQWMGTSRLAVTTKSATAFPAFNDTVAAGMAAETPAFVQYVLWTGDHKLNTMLTSPLAFVTSALAPIYGVTAPSGSTTTPKMVTPPAAQGRSGILTQPGFLSVQAHPDQTSPVLRGKFVRAKLLCAPPSPPPDTVNITIPDASSAKTARDRFGAHLSAGEVCSGCHSVMDPIGFAFEQFDAIGQFRTTENGVTIDTSGQINMVDEPGLAGPFNGVRELGTKLAASDMARDCVATQWFRFAAGRNEQVPDTCSIRTLQENFAASGGDLIELVVGITQLDAFWYRAPYAQ
jgi:hypothetical protein